MRSTVPKYWKQLQRQSLHWQGWQMPTQYKQMFIRWISRWPLWRTKCQTVLWRLRWWRWIRQLQLGHLQFNKNQGIQWTHCQGWQGLQIWNGQNGRFCQTMLRYVPRSPFVWAEGVKVDGLESEWPSLFDKNFLSHRLGHPCFPKRRSKYRWHRCSTSIQLKPFGWTLYWFQLGHPIWMVQWRLPRLGDKLLRKMLYWQDSSWPNPRLGSHVRRSRPCWWLFGKIFWTKPVRTDPNNP